MSTGHDQPCFYCGEPCDSFAGNPSKWPLAFPEPDGTGISKWRHTGCVMKRLALVAKLEAENAELRRKLAEAREPVWPETVP